MILACIGFACIDSIDDDKEWPVAFVWRLFVFFVYSERERVLSFELVRIVWVFFVCFWNAMSVIAVVCSFEVRRCVEGE